MEAIKRAIVTGGSRGIGRCIARALAQNGYNVAISCAANRESAEHVAQEIRQTTGRACYVFQADFNDLNTVRPLIQDAIAALGGLDLLVNNAALTGTHQLLLEMTDEYLEQMLHINFSSYILATREAAGWMKENGIRGTILNISSIRGLSHVAFPHDAIYGAAKAGLDRAMESFALSLAAYGIRINSILPGAISKAQDEIAPNGQADYASRETFGQNKIPLGRLGEPKDIASAVLFLASDAAAYITGASLVVDGGLSLPGMPERQ